MKIVAFTPYGSMSQEAGIIYLLANFARDFHSEVMQLRCNGAYSLCDRDSEQGWQRGVKNCLSCMAEQGGLAKWSEIPQVDLSSYINAEQNQQTFEWVHGLNDSQLLDAVYQGVRPHDLYKHSNAFTLGFKGGSVTDPDKAGLLREIVLSSVRTTIAADGFYAKERPDLVLLAGSSDLLSSAFYHAASEKSHRVAKFVWDVNQKAIVIHHPMSEKTMPCEILLEGIQRMRSDSKTWSEELITILDSVLEFLEVPKEQLSLPIAN